VSPQEKKKKKGVTKGVIIKGLYYIKHSYVLPKKKIVLMLRYLVDFEHKCLSQLQMTQVDREVSILYRWSLQRSSGPAHMLR
jgi:hypothetical protein